MSLLERLTTRGGRPADDDTTQDTVRLARKDFTRRRRRERLRRSRPLLVLLLVAAVVAGTGWVVLGSPYVTAERVRVDGVSVTGPLDERQVRQAADVPLGTPLARVDLAAVRSRVEDLLPVRSASVSRVWPHTVRVEVTERTAVAVVRQDGRLGALDADGVVFRPLGSRPRGLPLVQSQPRDAVLDDDALVEAGRVVDALPRAVSDKVDHLVVASADRLGLVMKDGRSVVWGSADHAADKARVLEVLLRQDGVRRIDVSVPGRPTTLQ